MNKLEYLVAYKKQHGTTCECTRSIFKTKEEVKDFIKSLNNEDKVLQVVEVKNTILHVEDFIK